MRHPFLLYLPAVILVSVAAGPEGRPLRDGALGDRRPPASSPSLDQGWRLSTPQTVAVVEYLIVSLVDDRESATLLRKVILDNEVNLTQPRSEPGDARDGQGRSRGGS